jgi:hypothetical protein
MKKIKRIAKIFIEIQYGAWIHLKIAQLFSQEEETEIFTE